jgi:hypothetical protein
MTPEQQGEVNSIRDWVVVLTMLAAALGALSILLMWIWADWGWIGLTASLSIAAFSIWRAERQIEKHRETRGHNEH